jgi:hypothetical protein
MYHSREIERLDKIPASFNLPPIDDKGCWMLFVESNEEIDAIERNHRALVSLFLHHCYDEAMISDVLAARRGFDHHVQSAWHLLIPYRSRGHSQRLGYSVDTVPGPDEYAEELAYRIAKELRLPAASLPCIVFRAGDGQYYFLKLGEKSKNEILKILREIGDLANHCHVNGTQDPERYREYVNTVVVNHLRKKKLLSALASALPWLERLTGGAVSLKELA